MEYSYDIRGNENDLILAIINEERWAQKQLYEYYYSDLMAICLRYAESEKEAEDILHESFMKIFKNIERYKPGTSLKSWMNRIVVNTSIDHFRKRNKNKTVELDKVYHLKSREPSALESISAAEIIEAMKQMSSIYRTIFNMFVVEGFSHKDIAKKLGISESTSRSNLVKARKKLKHILLSKDKFYDR